MTEGTMSYWSRQLKAWFNSCIPDDYLTFDYETTGFERDYDLPIDFGYTLIRGRKMVVRKSFILDWTRRPKLVDPDWLRARLYRIEQAYASRGEPYHYSMKRLRREGKDPLKVLKFNYDLFCANRNAGASFAGHNAAFYDCEMAKSCFYEYLGKDWVWGGNEVYDTGTTEKVLECARKLDPARCPVPKPGETMYEFFVRASRGRHAGIIWNAKACVERYKLEERFGVDTLALHGAEEDSYVCHLLVEEQRDGRLDPPGV